MNADDGRQTRIVERRGRQKDANGRIPLPASRFLRLLCVIRSVSSRLNSYPQRRRAADQSGCITRSERSTLTNITVRGGCDSRTASCQARMVRSLTSLR